MTDSATKVVKSEAAAKVVKSEIAVKADTALETNMETQGIPRGWTMIRGNGNYCVRYSGGRRRITQGSCNGRNNVMWRFIRYGGRYIIQNKSGYVMDLYAYKRNNGAHIYSWNRKNGTNQRWSFSNIGGGKYLIRNQHSTKCLDNTGKARRGVGYHQWSCNRRNRNQQFSLVPKNKPRRVKKSRSRRNKPKKSRRNKSKNSRRNKPKNNKMKYNKKKTVKFMNGKYSFNLKSGKDFCSTKCSSNKSSKTTVCFNDGVKKCKSCSFNGNKKDSKGKDSQELCNTVCKSINNDKCDFFAYVDDKKRVINKRLLNRFGRIFVKKFIKKQK